jgi:putative flippase GtrA
MESVAHRARFAAAMTAITGKLPFGLSRVVAPSVVGYLLINLCTFLLDLALLAVFHGGLPLPLPVAVTLSYGSAGAVSYIANRVLNFRSHGPLGRQVPLYVVIMASNYFIFVLGLTNVLAAVGVFYELARVMAACCEGVYLYCCMRWLIFRDTARPAAATGQAGATELTAAPESSRRASAGRPER